MLQAKAYFDTHHHVGAIDQRIFSGFLEHLGRAVYEGVYDPESPLSDAQGFRRDVLEALRAMRMPLVRYPGGNFVSCYDWTDGIGPRDQRPVRVDYAWKSRETNQFGTDEFMAWCQEAGSAPMMAVNLGTGTPKEASALLEYCNLPGGTYWSDRRIQNGHDQPYGARLWCLGNEMDGDWQAGHVPAEVYAQRAKAAAIIMKGLDAGIETVVCGSSGRGMSTYLHWDRTVLEYCWENIDYISAHRYSGNHRNDSAWFLAEGVEIDRVVEDYAALLNYVRGVKRSEKRVYLSFDEWNVWYKNMEMDGKGESAPHLLEEVYNLEDALVCAQYLSSFIRHADVVKVACLAQIVNVIAPLLTKRDGLLVQSIYYPIVAFAQHARGLSLVPALEGPTYKAGERGDVAALDAAMSYDEATGTVAAFLVNREQQQEMQVALSLGDQRFGEVLSVEVLGGDDVKAANSWEEPRRVAPRSAEARVSEAGELIVTVPAPGFAVVRARVSKR